MFQTTLASKSGAVEKAMQMEIKKVIILKILYLVLLFILTQEGYDMKKNN